MSPYSYRHDPAVPDFADDRPVVIFDGHCVMCSGSARFILRHDPHGAYRLLPAQTPLGQALFRHYGLDPDDLQTFVLLAGGIAWFRSEAVLRIAAGLGWPWAMAAVLRVVPTGWRDGLYGWVAKRRLKLFGRREICYLGDPAQRERFLG